MQQRQITDFLPPPDLSTPAKWFDHLSSHQQQQQQTQLFFSPLEQISQKSNLRHRSNNSYFRILSTSICCPNEQDTILQKGLVILPQQQQISTINKNANFKATRRDRETNNLPFDDDDNNRDNGENNQDEPANGDDEDEEIDPMSSPLTGFIGFVSARALVSKDNNCMSSNNLSQIKIFNRFTHARGDGRDPTSMTRQLTTMSIKNLSQDFSSLVLSVAPQSTILYRVPNTFSQVVNEAEILEPMFEFSPEFFSRQQQQHEQMTRWAITNEFYTRGCLNSESHQAILSTNTCKIHIWDIETQQQQTPVVAKPLRNFNLHPSKDGRGGGASSSSSSQQESISALIAIDANIHCATSLVSKLVTIFDTRVSNPIVSQWSSTGQTKDPLVVSFANNNNFSGLGNNNNIIGSSSPFGIVAGGSSIARVNFGPTTSSTSPSSLIISSNNNNNNNNAPPICMSSTQTSNGAPCIVVADSASMLRVWDLRRISTTTSVGANNNNNNNKSMESSSSKPLYEVNFRQTATAAIGHVLQQSRGASSSHSSPLLSSNASGSSLASTSSLGTIASLKPDPTHPFSVWVNTTGGFFGRIELSGKQAAVPHAFYTDDSYRGPLQIAFPSLQSDVQQNSIDVESVVVACPRLFSRNVLVACVGEKNGASYQRKQTHIHFPHQPQQQRRNYSSYDDHDDDYNSHHPQPIACIFVGSGCEEKLVVEDHLRQLWVKNLTF